MAEKNNDAVTEDEWEAAIDLGTVTGESVIDEEVVDELEADALEDDALGDFEEPWTEEELDEAIEEVDAVVEPAGLDRNERGERMLRKAPLFSADGKLAQIGYATRLLARYDKSRIAAPKRRRKEWDYYLVGDDNYAVALTLSDLGYMGLMSVSVLDLRDKSFTTNSALTLLPLGKYKMPESSGVGISAWSNDKVGMRFETVVRADDPKAAEGALEGELLRKIHARFKDFKPGVDLEFSANLASPDEDTMVIATPWDEDPLAFYYNQKTLAMPARAVLDLGDFHYEFDAESTFGLLDWGRGVWTRDNIWYWGVGQGWQDGRGGRTPGSHRFGMNLGYGFGNTDAASENMVFIDGHALKLGRVDFGIPVLAGAPHSIRHNDPEFIRHGIEHTPAIECRTVDYYDLIEPWHVVDDEGMLDLVFTPDFDRVDYMDYKLVRSDQHQVFGIFNGWVKVPADFPCFETPEDFVDIDNDGMRLFVIQGLRGSAEVIHNMY